MFGRRAKDHRQVRSAWAGDVRRSKFADGVYVELRPDEYADLCWLARNDADAGVLLTAGIDEEMSDGGAVLGPLSRSEIRLVNDRIDERFLRGASSRGLVQKMRKLFDAAL